MKITKQTSLSVIPFQQLNRIHGGKGNHNATVAINITGNNPNDFAFNIHNKTPINDNIAVTLNISGNSDGIVNTSFGLIATIPF